MTEIVIHLLVEPSMEPIPPDLQVTIFDADLRIVDDKGKTLATGKHVGLNGAVESIRRWLRPFARVWVGRGTPAFQQFDVCHIGDEAT
jgi:hypothetical protein